MIREEIVGREARTRVGTNKFRRFDIGRQIGKETVLFHVAESRRPVGAFILRRVADIVINREYDSIWRGWSLASTNDD